ncbi:hypothetical protein [Geobacillus sp. 47C-IIb]|uniref:hypothetical protein n=1 Tax=Geobacillus sp. 47C-IIb TaxID=1963026 RepID=UPI00351C6A6A
MAGGMLLLSVVPPAKGAGIAGKAAIKGAKALDTASTLSKVKHVVHGDKIKGFFQTIYHQVVKAPLTETARLFKKQWDEFVKSVASVSWQPAYAGDVGLALQGGMNEAKDVSLNMIKNVEGGAIGKSAKGTGKGLLPGEGKVGTYKQLIKQGKAFDNLTPHHMPSAEKSRYKAK